MLASPGTPRRATALAQFLALALLASLTSAAEVRLDFVSSDPAHAAKLLLEATTPSAVRSWLMNAPIRSW